MKTLIIESWRAIPHSYAVINQFQCLELLKRPEIGVFHRDLPYHNPNWRPVVGLFPAEDEAVLRSIPAPRSGQGVDATLRIAYPFNFSPAAGSPRTVVWGTSEYACLQTRDFVGGRSLAAGVEPGVVVVTCSNWARSGFVNAGIDPVRISVVPLGYDPQLFAPPSLDERRPPQSTGMGGVSLPQHRRDDGQQGDSDSSERVRRSVAPPSSGQASAQGS